MLQFILALKGFYSETGLHVVVSQYVAAGLLSIFYLLKFPTLVPQADYFPIGAADAQIDGPKPFEDKAVIKFRTSS